MLLVNCGIPEELVILHEFFFLCRASLYTCSYVGIFVSISRNFNCLLYWIAYISISRKESCLFIGIVS